MKTLRRFFFFYNEKSEFSELIYKTILIGIVSVFSKLFLIIIPYILNADDYNYFNKNYYSLSLVIIISGFGFEFAYQRNKISLILIGLLILINSSLTIFFLSLAGIIKIELINLFLIIPAAIISNIVNINAYFLLFNKKLKDYSLFLVSYFLSVIILYFVALYFHTDPFRSYILALAGAFVLSFPGIRKTLNCKGNDILKMYSFGINALVINGFFAVVMSINHIISGRFLSVEESNNIILVWMGLVPLLYISNIFEKVIYNSIGIKKKIIKWSLFNGLLMFLFAFILLAFILFFDGFLPSSAVRELLLKYFFFVFPVIFIFAFLNSFINAYTFKYLNYDAQRNVMISYLIIFLAFGIISVFTLNGILIISDVKLLILTGITLSAAIIIKSIIVISDIRKLNKIEKIF